MNNEELDKVTTELEGELQKVLDSGELDAVSGGGWRDHLINAGLVTLGGPVGGAAVLIRETIRFGYHNGCR